MHLLLTVLSCLFVFILTNNCVDGYEIDSHVNWKLLPKTCGIRKKEPLAKVQGGTPAKQGYHPWMANLFFSGNDYFQQNPLCAGSVLSERYILTAGHCCNLRGASPVIVRVGEFDFKESRNCTGVNRCNDRVQDIKVESVLIHPQYKVSYNIGYAHRDICLIRLQKLVQINDYVEPICLPNGSFATDKLIGETMDFAGWGQFESESVSMVLRVATVTIFPSKKCVKQLHKLLKPETSTEICVEGRKQKFCYGDSGGPLAYKGRHKSFYVVGIASYSTEDLINTNCEDDYPMVFTDVTKFLNWILDNLKP